MFEWLFKSLWTKNQAGPGDTQLEAASVTVKQGKRYRATVSLSWGEQMVASNDYISNMFVGFGFKNVKVTGDGGTRLAEGTWGKPDTTAPVDSHISDVTEIA